MLDKSNWEANFLGTKGQRSRSMKKNVKKIFFNIYLREKLIDLRQVKMKNDPRPILHKMSNTPSVEMLRFVIFVCLSVCCISRIPFVHCNIGTW